MLPVIAAVGRWFLLGVVDDGLDVIGNKPDLLLPLLVEHVLIVLARLLLVPRPAACHLQRLQHVLLLQVSARAVAGKTPGVRFVAANASFSLI